METPNPKKIEGFKTITIIERDTNWGLANSIITGVSEVVNKYDRVIVLEDDLLTASTFLRFMNESLLYYQDIPKIFSITGYNLPSQVMKIPRSYLHDVYFNPRAHSWGWATWNDRWEKLITDPNQLLSKLASMKAIDDFNFSNYPYYDMLKQATKNEIDSWAILFYGTSFIKNGLHFTPNISYTKNIGFDGSGIHCGNDFKYNNQKIQNKKPNDIPKLKITPNRDVPRLIEDWRKKKPPLSQRIKTKIIGKI